MTVSLTFHHDLTLSDFPVRSLLFPLGSLYNLHSGVLVLVPVSLHIPTRSYGSVYTAFWFFLATLIFSDLYPKLSCSLFFLAFLFFMIYGKLFYG
jgi:hypothetical protein